MGKAIDLRGRQFGRLAVLGRAEKLPSERGVFWSCLCACGNTHPAILGSNLVRGNTTSCGCVWEAHTQRLNQGKSRAWTAEEDAMLGAMSDRKLAAILGCSDVCVGDRRRRLGIGASCRRGATRRTRWTKTRDEQIVAMTGQGRTDSEIAAILGCTPRAVQVRRQRIGKTRHAQER